MAAASAESLMKMSSNASSVLCNLNGSSRRPLPPVSHSTRCCIYEKRAVPFKDCRNIGIMAHIDAGKNIKTGRILHHTKRSKTTKIRCIGWDPEGILGGPQSGHIARLEFKRRLEKDAEAREAFQRQVLEQKERARALRESRVIPDTVEELVEYFLDTEAQEIEFEIARLRPRLNEEFFSHLKLELGKLRFAVSKTQDMEDRVIELEALQKALEEGVEAYDRMQSELIRARKSLMKLLTSNDVKATLLDMVEQNELNRSLLTLLDQNIANAYQVNQTQAAEYMEKIRGAMLKYITV